ncbi:MAG: hypothetical protein K2Z81_21430, partial [Cyanobacteria bacterium]|nr:hypothetical protein [Cyanobacteriota bacterium]
NALCVPGPWFSVDQLDVRRNSLWAGDPCCMNKADGCLVEVQNGKYIIEAQGYDLEGVHTIGRARVRMQSPKPFSVGRKIGEVGTDSAVVAICDMNCLDEVIGNDNDSFQSFIEITDWQPYGSLLYNGVQITYVASGIGDGTGPARSVKADADCIGMELDFICDS